MMAGGLAILSFVSALVDWYATWQEKSKWRYVTKPLPIILLLAAFGVFRPELFFPLNIFALGLLFGLMGDILLMFKRSVFFIAGLLTFLVGHLCYIVGFNIENVQSSMWMLLFLVPVVVMLGYVSIKIIPYAGKKMRIAVWLYAVVLVSMFYSTLLTVLRIDWKLSAIILAIAGGSFFVASDTMLAFDRFVSHRNQVWVMVTYHLAQMAIIAAVVIQYA